MSKNKLTEVVLQSIDVAKQSDKGYRYGLNIMTINFAGERHKKVKTIERKINRPRS
jgi:hypothetical protein